MAVRSLGLFCAASETIDALYVQAACEVGHLVGSLGITLVYGGAKAGLMETTAAAAKEKGAHIVGVFPRILIERNRVSELPDEKVVTENLSDRKDNILLRSDVLLALPGGVGTLDEVFHVMAAATIGYHRKHVIFYNVNGFWDGILAQLDSFRKAGFVRGNADSYYTVANNIAELEELLKG